jgi:hypothetical protein
MKYAIWCETDSGIIQYTFYLLKYLAEINNHKITNFEEADFILFSICDVSQILKLKKMREQYPLKKIIVGGHFAVFFKICILFADYVNIGQAFEFFKCQSEKSIKNLKSIYYQDCNKIIEPSILIEWEKIPLCKITKNSYYYWNSVGCKNKCKFCLTSWTNSYQKNDKNRILSLLKTGKNINFVSNENDNLTDIKEQGKSIMLKDFLKIEKHYCNYYRIGLEFATEKNRQKLGKFFSDTDLYQSILKAVKDKVRIQFFCIAGMDEPKDWYKLFSNMPSLSKGWAIKFKFTNLEYQMFTPLYKELININTDNYFTQENTSFIFNNYLKIAMKCGRISTIKYPAWALWRTGMTNSINLEQFNVFYDLRNCKDINIIKKAIFENGIYKNDYSNKIKFWYQKDV